MRHQRLPFGHTDRVDKEPQAIEQAGQYWVSCAICFNMRSERVPALAIVNGISVCEDHVSLASKPSFTLWQLRSERKNL